MNDSSENSEREPGDDEEDWDDWDEEKVEWSPTSPQGGTKRACSNDDKNMSPYKRIMTTPQK